MPEWLNYITTFLSGAFVHNFIKSISKKIDEKETRKFNVRYKAYTAYSSKLLNLHDIRAETISKIDVLELDAQSSQVLLVAPKKLAIKVVIFNRALMRLTDLIRDFGNKSTAQRKKGKLAENISKEADNVATLRNEILDGFRKDLGVGTKTKDKDSIFPK